MDNTPINQHLKNMSIKPAPHESLYPTYPLYFHVQESREQSHEAWSSLFEARLNSLSQLFFSPTDCNIRSRCS